MIEQTLHWLHFVSQKLQLLWWFTKSLKSFYHDGIIKTSVEKRTNCSSTELIYELYTKALELATKEQISFVMLKKLMSKLQTKSIHSRPVSV